MLTVLSNTHSSSSPFLTILPYPDGAFLGSVSSAANEVTTIPRLTATQSARRLRLFISHPSPTDRIWVTDGHGRSYPSANRAHTWLNGPLRVVRLTREVPGR